MVRAALGECPAIVMAHPDDETLWCGGLPVIFPEKRWAAICCSIPRLDPVRAEHFFDACAVLRAKGILLSHIESEPSLPLQHLAELDLLPFSALVTHGADGEYGHLHHRQLHQVIRAMSGSRQVLAVGFLRGRHRFELTTAQAARKLQALQCYRGPSAGSSLPKWAHLLERYCPYGYTLERETYDLL